MVLIKSELDALLGELGPKVDNDAHRLELGLGAYTGLFKAHPEYISKFTKLQGCTADNVMASEGIKHYAKTLVDDLVGLLSKAADSGALDAGMVKTGKDHITRDVTPAEFKGGEKIFIDFFNSILTKPENKASMEKFLKFIFPGIAAHF